MCLAKFVQLEFSLFITSIVFFLPMFIGASVHRCIGASVLRKSRSIKHNQHKESAENRFDVLVRKQFVVPRHQVWVVLAPLHLWFGLSRYVQIS